MSRFFSLIFVLLFSFSAFAQDNSYLIRNLPVDVSDATPALAKELAAKTVNREAFLILLSRLQLDEKMSEKISDEEINDMIGMKHVSNEKIAGNNYSATFDLRFAKDFVEHILSQKNTKDSFFTPNEEENNETFLIVPIQLQGNEALVWRGNKWRNVFAKELANSNKFILIRENLENITAINSDNAFDFGYEESKDLNARYNSRATYLLFFDFDEIANKISVNISSFGKIEKKQIKINFSNINTIDPQNLNEKIISRIIEYLSNLKFAKTVFGVANFKVKIDDLDDWLKVKNEMENSQLVDKIEVKSITHNAVLISVNYIGDADIINSFASFGMRLRYLNENNYILYAN